MKFFPHFICKLAELILLFLCVHSTKFLDVFKFFIELRIKRVAFMVLFYRITIYLCTYDHVL